MALLAVACAPQQAQKVTIHVVAMAGKEGAALVPLRHGLIPLRLRCSPPLMPAHRGTHSRIQCLQRRPVAETCVHTRLCEPVSCGPALHGLCSNSPAESGLLRGRLQIGPLQHSKQEGWVVQHVLYLVSQDKSQVVRAGRVVPTDS